jgi:hypothetical protein
VRRSVCLAGFVLAVAAGCGTQSHTANDVRLYAAALGAYGDALEKIAPCLQGASTRKAVERCSRHWAPIDDRAGARAIAAARAYRSDVKGACHAAMGTQVAALKRTRRLQGRAFADGDVSSPRFAADLDALSASLAALLDSKFDAACKNPG